MAAGLEAVEAGPAVAEEVVGNMVEVAVAAAAAAEVEKSSK